ncbi:hypothetical protein CHARACLAT_032672 [Characodon lateralis]|uniref:Uncharacterized protein n=1 Tax=Characodon lateralis TaxID=208331 RepID=A0ABU7F8A2_9TELE|nr:hypothetical protein [Characodon lateralis]
MAAKTVQRFNRTVLTVLTMVDQRRSVDMLNVISRGCPLKIDVYVLPALRSACQWSHHTLHTSSNWSAWLSSQKEASSKDDVPANSLLKTSSLTWFNGTMSCGLMRPRYIYLV